MKGRSLQGLLGPWLSFLFGVMSHKFLGYTQKKVGLPGSRYGLGRRERGLEFGLRRGFGLRVKDFRRRGLTTTRLGRLTCDAPADSP